MDISEEAWSMKYYMNFLSMLRLKRIKYIDNI